MAMLFAFLGPIGGLQAQYYFTGTTYADSAKPEPFTKILLHSNKMVYQSGGTGDFGIPSALKSDTISCWKEGFDTSMHVLVQGKQNFILLTPNSETLKKAKERGRLSNLVPGITKNQEPYLHNGGETYPALVENPWVNTARFSEIGISPNTNRASYANIRRFLQNGMLVNPHAVRLEEIINYFSLSFTPLPAKGEVFSVASRITDCPWDSARKILFINALAREVDFAAVPPANLVFLIDNSGSMNAPNRMPLLKAAFSMLVKSLRPADRVAIVTYGGAAGIYLPPTSGALKQTILQAIDSLEANGATSGSSGINLAYQLALTNQIKGGNNRVIVATDGDFNVGATTEKELEELVVRYRSSGVNLTCLGLGMGNFKDSKIETLARHGNGNYAYLDNEEEAEKVMVQELTQNMYAVAEGVTMKVELEKTLVKQFRLVGYQNRKESWYSNKATLVGGEIGSGSPVNTLFEIIPTDSSLQFLQKNRGALLGKVSLEYSDPANPKMGIQKREYPIILDYKPLDQAEKCLGFMASLTMYGNLLKTPVENPDASFERIKQLATLYAEPANAVQIGFIDLVEKTGEIYRPPVQDKKGKSPKNRKGKL